jgi:hypothetical protein
VLGEERTAPAANDISLGPSSSRQGFKLSCPSGKGPSLSATTVHSSQLNHGRDNEELSCRPEPCQPICFSQAQPLASDCTLPVSSNDKLCTSDLRHLIQISPRPARRVFSRAPFTPQAGWGRSSLRTNAALGAALPGPGPPRRQPTHGSRSSKPATLAAPAPPAPRPQRPQVAIIRKEVLTSTEEYLCQNLGLCFSPRMSDLVVHNIEVSCAAESPTRSLPTDSQRLHSGSIVHFRRQLHRFVRWLAFPHQPTES